MSILSQITAAPTVMIGFIEVAYLQSSQETALMDGLLEDYEEDSLILDLMVSEYDYTNEQPRQIPQNFSELWLPSFKHVYDLQSYIVIRDVFGNYAIYKKVWF